MRIVYEGKVTYVSEVEGKYEICVRNYSHAICIGTQNTEAKAIRTAKRLDRYPDKAVKFARSL